MKVSEVNQLNRALEKGCEKRGFLYPLLSVRRCRKNDRESHSLTGGLHAHKELAYLGLDTPRRVQSKAVRVDERSTIVIRGKVTGVERKVSQTTHSLPQSQE